MKWQQWWRSPALVTLALVLTLGSTAGAKTAIVYTDDRPEPYRGEFVSENAEQFVIRSRSGINIPIPRNKIRKIEWELTLTEQYQQKRKALAHDDYAGRYKLARWAYDQKSQEGDVLAKAELESLMLAQPDNEPAKILHGLVVAQMDKRKAEQANARDKQVNKPDRPKPDGDKPKPPVTLDREQVNELKVYVLDINSKPPPRLSIPPKVVEEFYEQYRAAPALAGYEGRAGKSRFKSLKAHEQLRVMFDARARSFYGKVFVRSEPTPLREYRTRWQRVLVLNNLSHFPEQTKGVYLLTDPRKANTEAYAYTNLLMLHNATYDGRKFIDADEPSQSLLVQWALPRDEADFPAPESKRWKPVLLRGKKDPQYKQFIQWVEALYEFGDRLPIEFTPPKDEDETETPEDGEPAKTPQPAG